MSKKYSKSISKNVGLGLDRTENGITLIALVITIIVLLILAAVSLRLVAGSDGLLNRASKAVDATEIATAKEQAELFLVTTISEYYQEKYSYSHDVGSKLDFIKDKIDDGVQLSKDYYLKLADEEISKITKGKELASLENLYATAEEITELKFEIYKGTSSADLKILEGTMNSDGKIEWTEVLTNVSGENTTPTPTPTPDPEPEPEPETYTITYNANDGTENPETTTRTKTEGEAYTIITNPFTAPTGKEFKEWNTSADGTGTKYDPNYSYEADSDLTLYAIWRHELKIDSTVSYEPTGTYTWDKTYASSDETGTLTLETVTSTGSVQSGNINMSVTSWKVLSIDETTGEVELVPATINSNTVRLQGAQGYNNGVQLLNLACSSLFSDSLKGITARSITIEDIEDAMTKAGVDSNNDGTLDWIAARNSYKNSQNFQYGNQTNAYSKASSYYPSLYAQERNSVINETKNTNESALYLSDYPLDSNQNIKLIGRTNNSATLGYLQASSSIRPYQSSYVFDNNDLNIYLDLAYTGILLPSTTSTQYWIASRFINLNTNACTFAMRNIRDGQLRGNLMFYSQIGNDNESSRPLFPVVTVPSAHIVPDGNNFKVQ